ncbi:MAG TPA: rRNA adenine N-6-methyltransferase family protein [Streptosporangiaceae bacterium]|nr:rRNA adenine N-6-methyltransferase family protein [Streptosporangiaceae bacterium]
MAGRDRRSQRSSVRRGRGARHGQARQGQWFAGPPPPNPRGEHFLTDRQVIHQLIRASGVGPGDLVFDLGAGFGALTGPLGATGAKVIAVELDPGLAGRLRRRFAAEADSQVSVVEADLRCIPLPRRPFYVVANPPFALTTWLCRRLLGDPAVRLAGAELLLEWGAAKGLAQGELGARWAARYEITLVRRVPAASFSPPPAAAAAHVSIRPRVAPKDQPATGHPATGRPTTGQPARGQPATGQLASDRPATGRSSPARR